MAASTSLKRFLEASDHLHYVCSRIIDKANQKITKCTSLRSSGGGNCVQ